MRFSVFTPTHDLKWIQRAAKSLEAQTCQDFEWIVFPNGVVTEKHLRNAVPSRKLVVVPDPGAGVLGVPARVGQLKRMCCDVARGDILVELDHDDELTPDCLEVLDAAFREGSLLEPPSDVADFVYSNTQEVGQIPYDAAYGWRTRLAKLGHETIAFPPSAVSFSRVWFAPNHVRAWRRAFYEQIGGHDPSLDVCDDLDLLCRTFLASRPERLRHVDKPLYVQHVTGSNTTSVRNARIQEVNALIYQKHVYALAEHAARVKNLLLVDLCSGRYPAKGYIGTDCDDHGGNVICDLNGTWPFPDNSVGVFRAHDALEHLHNPIHTMKEIQRCLAPGGWLLSCTPSTDGRGAFQDPTHVAFWNQNSFWYYTRKAQAQYIGTPVRFQNIWTRTFFPSEWHRQNNISYVEAHLIKLDGLTDRPPGLIEI